MLPTAAALAAALAAPPAPPPADWPQWMGPNRDGEWHAAGVPARFPAGGPRKVWAAPCGGGYSGPAVAAGRVFVFDYLRRAGDATNNPAQRAELTGRERVLCLDAATGASRWQFAYDCPYQVSYPAGPRCTPTVDGDRVYALGAMGHLHCLDAATGELRWKRHFPTDYPAPVPIWGFSGHPLVYKGLVVCVVGGDGSTVVAFDKLTGKEVWKNLSAPEPGYSPPTVVRAGGVDQLVVWHAAAVNGLDPLTGRKYWSVPLKPDYGMAIMAPRLSGDRLFAGGIRGKAAVVKLAAGPPAAEVEWRATGKNAVYPVNATPLAADGVLYGVDQTGALMAVDLATGDRLWKTFKPLTGEDKDDDFTGLNSGTAFLVRNAGRYFLFTEAGDLVAADLTRQGYTELDRAHLTEPTGEAFGRKVVWSHPAFAGTSVYVRNDREVARFDLAP